MKSEFQIRNRAEWEAAIKKVFPHGAPEQSTWSDLATIVETLRTFSGKNLNYTMCPKHGGIEVMDVAFSSEEGCIELQVTPELIYVCRPKNLVFHHFDASPWNSFFLLETLPLMPSGVYEGEEVKVSRETVLELPDGQYVERYHLDAGYFGHDESGFTIPIPNPHRLVNREFGGSFLMIAKASYWNSVSAASDGRHERMSAKNIRDIIHSAVLLEHAA